MNKLKRQNKPGTWIALRLTIICSAACLLASTWLPVIEIKGFDTFNFASVALWAGKVARFTLGGVILAALLPSLLSARWLLALSVGILFSPLLDMIIRSLSLAEMMGAGDGGDIKSLIVPLTGFWVAAAGLALWIVDLVIESVKVLIQLKQGSNQRA